MNLVTVLLRLEGVALFALATWAYFARLEGSWVVFAALLLAPDLSIAGFLGGTRIGAVVYNLVHTEVLPAVLLLAGFVSESGILTLAAIILGAHIGMDRACGYGLKFPMAFKDTHLQRLAAASESMPS